MFVHNLNHRFVRSLVTIVSLISFSGSAAALSVASPNVQVPTPDNTTQQIQDRVDNYKQRFSSEVAGDSTDRLKGKCEDIQLKVGALGTRVMDMRRRKLATYSAVLDRLHAIDSRLTDQAVPHPDLHGAILKADADFAQLGSRYDNLQSSLDDARNIDCSNDVAGFLASIAAARSAQLSSQSQLFGLRDGLVAINTNLLPKLKALVEGEKPYSIGLSDTPGAWL